MNQVYFIRTLTCAGGFDVVGLNEGLFWAGRSPHPPWFIEVPTQHRVLSELAALCPEGASALQEAHIFELT